jgi:hypothetical protein
VLFEAEREASDHGFTGNRSKQPHLVVVAFTSRFIAAQSPDLFFIALYISFKWQSHQPSALCTFVYRVRWRSGGRPLASASGCGHLQGTSCPI